MDTPPRASAEKSPGDEVDAGEGSDDEEFPAEKYVGDEDDDIVEDCAGRGGRSQVYVMYHGTSRSNAQSIVQTGFRQSAGGMLGRGVYVTRNLNKARRFPIGWPQHDKVVIQVKVRVGKVKAIRYQGHPLQTTWHDQGYSTAWVPPNCGMVPSGEEENCVWNPCRITILRVI